MGGGSAVQETPGESRQEALPWGPLERELRRTEPEQWLRLGPEAGLNALAQRRILIGRFATAPELQRALAHAGDPLPEWRAEADRYVPGLPERVSPCRRFSLEGPICASISMPAPRRGSGRWWWGSRGTGGC